MQLKHPKIHIGLRTIKTTAAVIIAMLIVESLGTTDSRLIFAMLGAMNAVQTTFTESVEASLAQIVGVIFGALVGVLLLALNLPSLVAIAIGIILVITLYNALHIRFSPGLPCFMVVLICSTPNVQPMTYAAGRVWDTAIGLAVGMLINTLIFPYDNSRQIRSTVKSLDRELIRFLEDMFDGDDVLPNTAQMLQTTELVAQQLSIFSNQKLLLDLRRQKRELDTFRLCEGKAQELVARMEILSRMGRPGRLNDENRKRLEACGAIIGDVRPLDSVLECDVVTNYHVKQILSLRTELLDALTGNRKQPDTK